eukprot:scaffold176134_cov19-Tisochrysis_lutea.AAC.1
MRSPPAMLHRKNFLQAGTMAKGASESGQVESYICSKIKRNPWASKPCAQYLGYFVAGVCMPWSVVAAGEEGLRQTLCWLYALWVYSPCSMRGVKTLTHSMQSACASP